MIQVRVHLGQVPQLIKKLNELDGYKRGLHLAGLHLQNKIRQYPRVSRRPQPFRTAKQRRAFFAMLQSGRIVVPYVRGSNPRSERLAQRWAVSRSQDGLTVTVGNNASYASRVQGIAGQQSKYHSVTGWKRIDEVAKSEGAKVREIISDEIRRDLRR